MQAHYQRSEEMDRVKRYLFVVDEAIEP